MFIRFRLNVEQKFLKQIYFSIIERRHKYDNENSIIFYVGPIKVYPCGYTKKIELIMNSYQFLFLWDHFFSAAEQAWGVNRDTILKIDDLTYEIPLTLEILLMFFEKTIVYLPITLHADT